MRRIPFLRSKFLKWITFCISILTLFFIFIISYQQTKDRIDYSIDNERNRSGVRPSQIIKGFHFDGYNRDRKTLSIKADSFVFDKKKIGFFRFSLINTAKLKNAVIELHGIAENTVDKTGKILKRIDFSNTLSKGNLSSITKKRIMGIEMEPVTIRVYDKDRIVSTISSKYAKIVLKNRNIVFKKRVRVVSGRSILTTEKLSFDPERCSFRTNRSFVLKTPGEETNGNHLEIDIYLDQLFTPYGNEAK